jgi:hypothetical protein
MKYESSTVEQMGCIAAADPRVLIFPHCPSEYRPAVHVAR